MANIPDLTNATLLIGALSIATERLTEIIKGMCFPSLITALEDELKESRRQAKIQILAVLCGITVSLLAHPITAEYFKVFFVTMPQWLLNFSTIISLGLLASGGSGMWNSILGYIVKLKDLTKAQAEKP